MITGHYAQNYSSVFIDFSAFIKTQHQCNIDACVTLYKLDVEAVFRQACERAQNERECSLHYTDRIADEQTSHSGLSKTICLLEQIVKGIAILT